MWIKLADGTFAEMANPDPRRVLTAEQLAEEKTQKEQEITMYENEITNSAERKTQIEAEILEMETLLNN